MILLIDNYDSFVHNLARYFAEMGCAVEVVRNDAASVDAVRELQPSAIVVSPGPCTPNEAGVSIELIRELAPVVPILGVCLGHQSIAAAFGGKVVRASSPRHGRTSLVRHDGSPLFAGLSNPFRATRYHSLVVDEGSLPTDLKVTAHTLDGVPMALAHRSFRTYGVQFHPESVLTEAGHRILANFLTLADVPFSQIPAENEIDIATDNDNEWSSLDAEWRSGTTPDAGPLHW